MISSFKSGKEFFEKGKMDCAEKHFLSIVDNSKKLKESYFYLGSLAFQKEDIELAVDYLYKCLTLDPFDKKALLELYKILRLSSRLYLFLPTLNNYLQKYPDDEEILDILIETRKYIKDSSDPDSFNCEKDKRHIPITYHKKLFQGQKKQINLIDSQLKTLKQDNYKYNKPHRNLLLGGIPGSGHNVLINILNKLDNIVCFENFDLEISNLPNIYCDVRNSLLLKSQNKQTSITNLKSDTLKNLDEEVVVGFKKNIGLLRINMFRDSNNKELEQLMNYGYRIIAVLRDPVFTIAQWNTPEYRHTPEAMITDDNLSPCWNNIKFGSNNQFERQAQIWQFYASFFWEFNKMFGCEKFWGTKIEPIKLVYYEQICFNMDEAISDICKHLTLSTPRQLNNKCDIKIDSSPQIFEQIKAAVYKFCPAAIQLGYVNPGTKNQMPFVEKKKVEIESRGEIDYLFYLNKFNKKVEL